MANVLQLWCILLALSLVQSSATPPTPSPQLSTPQEPRSCGLLMFKMIDCLPYIIKRSKMGEPDGSCCSGFLEVWKFASNCVCEALKGSVDLGFQLNMTRVDHISCDCGFKHISLHKCLSNLLRAESPVQSARPSPATPLAQPMKTSDAYSFSLSNLFVIIIDLVLFSIF